MEFVSASGGGAASGSTVAWTLGALAARQGGQQTVRLRVATAHKPSQTIVISGSLTNGSGTTALGQALAWQYRRTSGGLRVSVTSTPLIVGHGSAPTFTISVTNEGNVAVQSARLTAGVPQMAENFNAPSGTICGRNAPGICGGGEQIDWNVRMLQPAKVDRSLLHLSHTLTRRCLSLQRVRRRACQQRFHLGRLQRCHRAVIVL